MDKSLDEIIYDELKRRLLLQIPIMVAQGHYVYQAMFQAEDELEEALEAALESAAIALWRDVRAGVYGHLDDEED